MPDNEEFIVIHTAPLLDSEDCRRSRKEDRGFVDYDERRKECEPATN